MVQYILCHVLFFLQDKVHPSLVLWGLKFCFALAATPSSSLQSRLASPANVEFPVQKRKNKLTGGIRKHLMYRKVTTIQNCGEGVV